jgi:hypothetical protein
MTNVLNNTKLVKRIDELKAKRETWEDGTYKASNEELCALLQDCYDLYMEVNGNAGLVKRLGKLLAERKLTEQSNTSLATRIVRLVFGECGKRVYTYARVLTVAAERKAERMSMLTFINNEGGIENIRRKKNGELSAAVINAKLIETAEQELVDGDALASNIVVKDGMRAAANSKYQFSVALIRCDSASKASIVYATSNQALVKAALVKAGSALQRKSVDIAQRSTRLKQLEKRRTIVGKRAA